MSSCYQFCEVLLTSFCGPKFFRNLFKKKMNFLRRSSSRKKSTGASSSLSSARPSYEEPRASSVRGAETEGCRWPCQDFMMGAGIKEEFDEYISNADLTAYMADQPDQYLHLTHSFTQHFSYNIHTSRVSFRIYEDLHSLSLEEFCFACKLPCWGSLVEPPAEEYSQFLRSLCFGEDRGVTQARIKSIQFPAIRYFALFNGKCIAGKQDCSALCAPDLSIIHTALTREKRYNLGAIVARRLQRNANDGDLYGGIYASRVAAHLRIPPRPNDIFLPYKYLNFSAMRAHRFLKSNARTYEYNLIFNKYDPVYVLLPAPALFDFQAKRRYTISKREAEEYNAEIEAARQAEEATQHASSSSYHVDYYPGQGWQ
jgi:hypothetical protein